MQVNRKNFDKTHGSLINTIIISGGTAASRVLGFVRETIIAALFGTSIWVDAYLIASMIPQALFSIIGISLTTAIIPLVTQYKEKEGQGSVLSLLNSITTLMLIVAGMLVLMGEVFAPVVIRIAAPGFSGQGFALAVELSYWMFPMMFFLGLAGLGTGILQSQKRFLYPSFTGIPYNFVIIAVLFLGWRQWGVLALAIGTVLGVVAQWAFQVPDLRHTGFFYRPRIDWKHPGLRQLLGLIVPVMIGTGAWQINILVNRMLASGLAEGSIAALNYAVKLNSLAYGIVAMAVARAIYPELSEAAVLLNRDKFMNAFHRSFNSLMLLIIPFTVGLIVLREPLVRVVYQRGAFDDRAAALTVVALLFYALGMPATSLREVVLRAYWSLQDTLTPMMISLGTVVLNVVLNLALVPVLAHGGLALGNSIASISGMLMLLLFLRRKLGGIQGRSMLKTGGKIVAASIIMGILVYIMLTVLTASLSEGILSDILILGSCGVVGCLFYCLMIKVLRVDEFNLLWKKVFGRQVKRPPVE